MIGPPKVFTANNIYYRQVRHLSGHSAAPTVLRQFWQFMNTKNTNRNHILLVGPGGLTLEKNYKIKMG